MKLQIIFIVTTILVACSSSGKVSKSYTRPPVSGNAFVITEISTDNTYGYSKENPINVGGVKTSEGPLNQRRFLNALAGPLGEIISYERRGSCCHFKTKNGFMGGGLLDIYKVYWEGKKDTILLYINLYDEGELKIPVGFTAQK